MHGGSDMKRVFILLTFILFVGCDKGYQLLIKSTVKSISYIDYPGAKLELHVSTLQNVEFTAGVKFVSSDTVQIFADRLNIEVNGTPVSYKIRDGFRPADTTTFSLVPGDRKILIYRWLSGNIEEGDEVVLVAKNYISIGGTFYDLEKHVFVTRKM